MIHRLPSPRGRARRRQSGLTLVEVSVAILIASTVLLASASAFSSSLSAMTQSERTTSAALFLETTLEDVSAQPYDNLLALNGSTVFEREAEAASPHVIQIAAFQAEVDLIQLSAALLERRTGRELGRVTMLRSRR